MGLAGWTREPYQLEGFVALYAIYNPTTRATILLAVPQKIYYQIGFGGTPTPSTIYATGHTF